MYEKENEKPCVIQQPSLVEFNCGLGETTNEIENYVIEIESKLHKIKFINDVVEKSDASLKETSPNCFIDELDANLRRLISHKNRLRKCLSHLNQII